MSSSPKDNSSISHSQNHDVPNQKNSKAPPAYPQYPLAGHKTTRAQWPPSLYSIYFGYQQPSQQPPPPPFLTLPPPKQPNEKPAQSTSGTRPERQPQNVPLTQIVVPRERVDVFRKIAKEDGSLSERERLELFDLYMDREERRIQFRLGRGYPDA